MDSPLNVWLVEDNVTYRESVGRLLKRADRNWEISIHGNCETALRAIATETLPHVILLDIRLPGLSGTDGILKFRQLAPHTHIVMLTSSDSRNEIQTAIRNGASGYLLKTSAPERVVDAVREVISGGAPLTPKVASTLLDQIRGTNPETAAHAAETYGLNTREQQTLVFLVNGLTMKEISDRMEVSYHTRRFPFA